MTGAAEFQKSTCKGIKFLAKVLVVDKTKLLSLLVLNLYAVAITLWRTIL
jgi:hypothetical protein